MANVSQTPETPKLGAYVTRIKSIYPNQDVIDETYRRVCSGGKMVETLLLLESTVQGVGVSERELEGMFLVQQEFNRIIPTEGEMYEFLHAAEQLERKREKIRKFIFTNLGYITGLCKAFKIVSEKVGIFEGEFERIFGLLPEDAPKSALAKALPTLKDLSERCAELTDKALKDAEDLHEKYTKGELEYFSVFDKD